jgi:nicotinamide-nucleotide amidase
VAYTVDAKRTLLGLDEDVLASGVVSESVAEAMAHAVARILGADIAIATTGVAGPAPHAGASVGRVCLAVWSAQVARAWSVDLHGDRDGIRASSVRAAIEGARELVDHI